MSDLHENDIVSCFCEEVNEAIDAKIFKFRNENTEAYVHFLHQDKRLDRWVPVDDLKVQGRNKTPHKEEWHSTRSSTRYDSESDIDSNEDDEIQKFEKIHKEVTKIRNIDTIFIGEIPIRAWYFSPYPDPFYSMQTLYICEHCFRYFGSKEELDKHILNSKEMTPPGKEIYRNGNISIFELHGKRQKLSCQCLCLLAKLFLDHKTLYYDVEGFVFYVLCECDENGCHIAAYFSKELESEDNNVLACIVVLPPYQRKGYGKLLISLSYELVKRQKISGGPERPLSDLGKIAFFSYWRDVIISLLGSVEIQSIEEIEKITSIAKDDIIDVLKKYQSVVLVKGEYELDINQECIDNEFQKISSLHSKSYIDPLKLIWFPEDDKE